MPYQAIVLLLASAAFFAIFFMLRRIRKNGFKPDTK